MNINNYLGGVIMDQLDLFDEMLSDESRIIKTEILKSKHHQMLNIKVDLEHQMSDEDIRKIEIEHDVAESMEDNEKASHYKNILSYMYMTFNIPRLKIYNEGV